MKAWTSMTAAEKTSAATAAKATMSQSEIAERFSTTKGAVAGALYRERRVARVAKSEPNLDPRILRDWAEIAGAAFGVSPKRVVDMEERRSLYRGVRHVLWYLLAQLEPPATLPGPHGSWRKRRETDGMCGAIARTWNCSRQSVLGALHIVEDMRDDDPAFDAKITALERKLGLA